MDILTIHRMMREIFNTRERDLLAAVVNAEIADLRAKHPNPDQRTRDRIAEFERILRKVV